MLSGSRQVVRIFLSLLLTTMSVARADSPRYDFLTDGRIVKVSNNLSLPSPPGADRMLFYDLSAGILSWLEAGAGLTITGTTLTASGTSSFLGLTDTPSSYSGDGGKVALVNVAETALEFLTIDVSDHTNLAVTTPITLTGDSIGIVNQGTTTTVLHGDAAGNASFGVVDISDDTNLAIDADHLKLTGDTLSFSDNEKVVSHARQDSFLEQIDFTISEAGGTVTGSLEKETGGDLTQFWSDDFDVLDCTPPKTVNLTAFVGASDALPTASFVYILFSAKTTLVVNSSWPSDSVEHIRIASIVLQSATTTGTDGALMVRNWNDNAFAISNPKGGDIRTNERLRIEHAKWDSGVALTVTGSGTGTVTLDTSAGFIYQLNRQSFPTLDMAGGDEIRIVNQVVDEGGAYETSTNLVTNVTHFVDGTDAGTAFVNNRYFNVVAWAVQNRTGEPSHLMLNLPTGQYNLEANAIADVSKFSVRSIPSAFTGTGFLIAELTFRLTGGGSTWTLVNENSLLGDPPAIASGGGTTTTTTVFSDAQLFIFANGDDSSEIKFDASAIDTGTVRTITMANANVGLADIATNTTAIGLNTTHRSSDGSDHTFIDQSVISGSTPTLTATNFSGISAITGLGTQAQNLVMGFFPIIDLGDIDGSVGDLTDLTISATLQTYWRFEDDLLDSSGNGRNLSVDSGSATFGNRGSKVTYSFNNLRELEADTGSAYTGVTGTAARAVSVWAKSSSASGNATIVAWGNLPSTAQTWDCHVTNLGAIRVATQNGNRATANGIFAYDGQWHHMVFQMEANSDMEDMDIWCDGVQRDSTTGGAGNPVNTTNSANVFIGSVSGQSATWDGDIDEVAIFSDTLSTSEITNIFNHQKEKFIGGTGPSQVDWTGSHSELVTDKSITGASVHADNGATGNFEDAVGIIITVVDGVITAITPP